MAAALGAFVLAPAIAAAAETSAETGPSPEVKEIFGSLCSWCHGDWGRKADKGPRLAGTQMTEQQVERRIHDGKPGYMPAFGKQLSPDEIKLMAQYIKSLKVTD